MITGFESSFRILAASPWNSWRSESWYFLAPIAAVVLGGLASVLVLEVRRYLIAHRAAKKSLQGLVLPVDDAAVMIWLSDADNQCTYVNQSWREFSGRSSEQEMGKGWSESIHPDDVAQCIIRNKQAFDTRQRFKIEYRALRFDGQYCWVADYGAPRHDLGGRFCGYISCRIDISEQKISEQCLHELSSELIHSQEEERKRIARELHDEYSQQLTLIGFELAKLDDIANAFPLVRQVVVAVESRIRNLSKAMNARAHQLHSLYLETIGLAPAMRRLCEDFSTEHSVAVDFVQNGTPPEMPANVRLSLFRILEEALQNIARDGGTRRCRVELNVEQQKLALRIIDSRIGFDTAGTTRRAGFTGMRERLREVQGDLQVRSSPATGTRLEVRVPINQARRPA